MEIAFERHATSKIRQADDLDTVTSMGFRGEALASIAAISHVELVSRTAENEIGKKVEIKGGNVINLEDAGCPKGTTITVTDLFYNTPVRYKFLKKDFTEAGYIEDVVTRIALVHPEIAIKLISSGKVIIQTSGNGDMKSVVYSIYGKDVAENIIDVNYEYEDIKISGVIGKPVIARSNRSNQLFFVNKRYIRDKILTSASEQAYKGLLTIGKYGFLVLNIEMNPQKVDVNVHPAKLEVRFEEENKIFKAIYHAIKDSLLKEDLIPDRTKIELDKQAQSNSWKMDSSPTRNYNKINTISANLEASNVMDAKEATTQTPAEQENKVDILEEINKMQNSPDSIDKSKEILFNNQNSAQSNNEESSTAQKKDLDVPLAGVKDYESYEAQTHGEHEKGESAFSKIEGIFSRFGKKGKEEEKEEEKEDLDDTKNFIAQIYNNKNENMSDETKKVDLSEISEKMQELDNLKVEPDYQNFDEMYARTFGVTKKEEPKVEEEKDEYKVESEELKTAENVSLFEKIPQSATPEYKFIGIAFSTYIIIEMNNELYIIDQHAAHERIMYEKIKANYYSDTNKDSQLMLLPDVINLSHKDMQIAKDNMEIFEKAGFVLEEFGENTIKLSGVPTVCLELDTKELFLETLDEINTVARTAKQEIEEKFIATVACKAAVKANMALTREEVDNLMKQLLVLPNPFTCPHGRPTAIRMTKNDIEKKFSRR